MLTSSKPIEAADRKEDDETTTRRTPRAERLPGLRVRRNLRRENGSPRAAPTRNKVGKTNAE